MQEKTILNTLEELDGGRLVKKLTRATSDVALGVVEHDKVGEIKLTIKISRISDTGQVKVDHKLNYTKPTIRGKTMTEDNTSTPMHVAARTGHMSITPDDQMDLFTSDEKTTQTTGE